MVYLCQTDLNLMYVALSHYVWVCLPMSFLVKYDEQYSSSIFNRIICLSMTNDNDTLGELSSFCPPCIHKIQVLFDNVWRPSFHVLPCFTKCFIIIRTHADNSIKHVTLSFIHIHMENMLNYDKTWQTRTDITWSWSTFGGW